MPIQHFWMPRPQPPPLSCHSCYGHSKHDLSLPPSSTALLLNQNVPLEASGHCRPLASATITIHYHRLVWLTVLLWPGFLALSFTLPVSVTADVARDHQRLNIDHAPTSTLTPMNESQIDFDSSLVTVPTTTTPYSAPNLNGSDSFANVHLSSPLPDDDDLHLNDSIISTLPTLLTDFSSSTLDSVFNATTRIPYPLSSTSSTVVLEPDLRVHHPILAVLLGLICVVVVFGNVLTMLSIYKERYLHTVTNYFVASLAAADCLVGAIVMPFSVVHEVMNKWWIFGQDW